MIENNERELCLSGVFFRQVLACKKGPNSKTKGPHVYMDYEPGSSVSTVSDYGMDDRSIGVRSPAEAKVLSSSLCVQTGSGAHPASCPMGTGGPFPGANARPGREADHSPHLAPRLSMSRSYTSSPSLQPSYLCCGTAFMD
jgi:hypothetical protein